MVLHQLAHFLDVLIDVFHLGDLYDLIYGLFDRRPCVVGNLLGIDEVAVEGQVSDEVERGLLGVDMNVVVHLVGHLGHLFAGRNSLAAHQQL